MKENRGVEATLRITTRDLGGGKDVYKIPPIYCREKQFFPTGGNFSCITQRAPNLRFIDLKELKRNRNCLGYNFKKCIRKSFLSI
jgi:hypothetical protein